MKPEWISDSLKAGKLLDFTNYLLYSNHNRKQPKLNFNKIPKETITSNNAETENGVVDEFTLSPDIFCSDEESLINETNKIEKQPNKLVVSTSSSKNLGNYLINSYVIF